MLDEKAVKEIKKLTKDVRSLEEWKTAVKNVYETYGKNSMYFVDSSFFDTEEMRTEVSLYEENKEDKVEHFGIIVKYSFYEKATKKCFPCNYGMVYFID
ncbi:MAG: hypothetical protein J6M60_06590 [Clostridia bacterium]|nr:hypothetical protein [Clostridia bacterium]